MGEGGGGGGDTLIFCMPELFDHNTNKGLRMTPQTAGGDTVFGITNRGMTLTIVRHFPHALSKAAVDHIRIDGRVGRGVRVSILLHCQRFLPKHVESQ